MLRFIKPAKFVQHQTKVVMRMRVARLKIQRFLQVCNGIIVAGLVQQQRTESLVRCMIDRV